MSKQIYAVVMSLKPVKLDPVTEAIRLLGHHPVVEGEKVEIEGDPEQPRNVETWVAAHNRMDAGEKLHPNAQIIVAIENGIFDEHGAFVDRALVGARQKTRFGIREVWGVSDGVPFPAEYVAEAARLGFDKMTVGKVMAGQTGGLSQLPAIVADHADPHLSLTGKSRAAYIAETVQGVFARLDI